MAQPTCIVGAGLAGLIAAHAWPQLPVLEASPEPTDTHKALLRFRSDAVAKLIGVEFRRVRVHKAIWMDGEFVAPSPLASNLYSQKCLGRVVGGRSIWNVEPVDRYIAPENLHELLLEQAQPRIEWGVDPDVSFFHSCISTAPLSVHMPGRLRGNPTMFQRAAITVSRFRLPLWDVHQTIYFPSAEDTGVYRASVTGDLLIVESTEDKITETDLDVVERAFGMDMAYGVPLGSPSRQQYGKIVEIDAATRKAMLWKLTHEFGIYSLGRFATWRNILLDDVVDDIAVIKRLANSEPYDRHRVLA